MFIRICQNLIYCYLYLSHNSISICKTRCPQAHTVILNKFQMRLFQQVNNLIYINSVLRYCHFFFNLLVSFIIISKQCCTLLNYRYFDICRSTLSYYLTASFKTLPLCLSVSLSLSASVSVSLSVSLSHFITYKKSWHSVICGILQTLYRTFFSAHRSLF